MTDETDSIQPTDDPDDGIEPAVLDELRALLRLPDEVDAPGTVGRDARIALAMTAYDEAVAAAPAPAPVIPLATRRRQPGRRLGAVAAAAVLVVGVGVGLRAATGSDDERSEVASDAAISAADPSTTAAGADGGLEERATEKYADPATAPAPQAAQDQFSTAAGAVNEAGTVGDLGEMESAVDLAATVRNAAAGDGAIPTTTVGDPPTTPAVRSDDATAATAACTDRLTALGFPRFTATLAGRPVVAAPTPGSETDVDIVHLDDCSSETVAGR